MSLFSSQEFLSKVSADQSPGREAETELVEKFKRGDLNAYKRLRRMYQPTIHRLALDWHPKSDDVSLAQIKMGVEHEFPKLLMNYDPNHSKGASLQTYMKDQLNRRMQNVVGDHVTGPYVSRTDQAKGYRYERALREAQREFGSNPTPEQIMRFLPEVTTVSELENYKRYYGQSFIGDVTVGKDDDHNMLFRDQFTTVNIGSDPDEKFQGLALDRVERVMREKLTPEEYGVVKDRTLNGHSMAQVAITHGISTTKLRSILEKWNKIKKDEKLV